MNVVLEHDSSTSWSNFFGICTETSALFDCQVVLTYQTFEMSYRLDGKTEIA